MASYSILTTAAARRSIRKLPKTIKGHVLGKIEDLATDPLKGHQLKGQFHFLRSLHIRYKGSDYRVIYQVFKKKKEILIYLAATRENFYKQLERTL